MGLFNKSKPIEQKVEPTIKENNSIVLNENTENNPTKKDDNLNNKENEVEQESNTESKPEVEYYEDDESVNNTQQEIEQDNESDSNEEMSDIDKQLIQLEQQQKKLIELKKIEENKKIEEENKESEDNEFSDNEAQNDNLDIVYELQQLEQRLLKIESFLFRGLR